jgi:type VI secretion system secreted protein VgrG
MSLFSQEGRLLRIKTGLPDDTLLLGGFSGREAISQPFLFECDLLSEDPALDMMKVLDKPVTIELSLPGGDTRYVHGFCRRFVQQHRRDPLTSYRAEVVPKIWFMSLSRDSRIFQEKSVLEIIDTILAENNITDVDVKCTKQYPKREYCVQYDESDLDFVSRLMEEEGIFYFFEHANGKHVLVIADANSAVPATVGATAAHMAEQSRASEDVVLGLQAERSVYVGKVTLRDYNPLDPKIDLEAAEQGDGRAEEIYGYPGGYIEKEEGRRYAKLRLGQAETFRDVVRGNGTMRSFVSGHKFDLRNHYRPDLNQSYVLTEVRHFATAGDYFAGGESTGTYSNQFSCIPHSVPFVPSARTPRPTVRGSQTAVVVGPAGEEIYVDKHARVKVQFFWDREGAKDERASCWVRVSTAWAGKGWGTIEIPRIGQEVIIDFLEGDPDQPIVIGRVYNADQVPPYTLPDNKTQSGVKSRSSPGGGTENFNEIRFEDKKGSEHIYIHAEKDKQVVVENNRTENVGNDETITIGHDRTETVKNDETITIENNRTESVAVDESISIGGNRTEAVSGNEELEIGGNRTHKVDGNEERTVGGNEEVDVGGNAKEKIGGNQTMEIGSNLNIKAASNITIKATGGKIAASSPTTIELTVGGSKIKITPAGIEISGPQIKINGTAMLELKAPMLKGQADAMLQLKGPMTQVNGDGMLMLKGGITMIN